MKPINILNKLNESLSPSDIELISGTMDGCIHNVCGIKGLDFCRSHSNDKDYTEEFTYGGKTYGWFEVIEAVREYTGEYPELDNNDDYISFLEKYSDSIPRALKAVSKEKAKKARKMLDGFGLSDAFEFERDWGWEGIVFSYKKDPDVKVYFDDKVSIKINKDLISKLLKLAYKSKKNRKIYDEFDEEYYYYSHELEGNNYSSSELESMCDKIINHAKEALTKMGGKL